MEPEAKRPKLSHEDEASARPSAESSSSGSAELTVAAGDVARHTVALPPSDLAASAVANQDGGSDGAGAEEAEGDDKALKVRRQKVAMLLGYCGAEYMGMQMNEPFPTIERDLLTALCKGGCIDDEDLQDHQRMVYQRASRTDKGVSAARQVISFRCRMHDNIVERANEHLPPVIRAFACVRTTKGFSSYKAATGRAYEYVMPSFALAPSLSKSVSAYRIDDEQLALANALLKKYVGRHNFHNFTSGRKHDDPSCYRQMRSFEVRKTVLYEGSEEGEKDMEFVILRVTGQSFMLHQIRKMIGLVLAILKGCCAENVMEMAWLEKRVDVPRAPGLGLLLDDIYFLGYNQRYGTDGIHRPLKWPGCDDEVEAFKMKYIVTSIVAEERKVNSMMKWLHTLPLHEYNKFSGHKLGPRTDETATAAATASATTTTTTTTTTTEAVSEEVEGSSSSSPVDVAAEGEVCESASAGATEETAE